MRTWAWLQSLPPEPGHLALALRWIRLMSRADLAAGAAPALLEHTDPALRSEAAAALLALLPGQPCGAAVAVLLDGLLHGPPPLREGAGLFLALHAPERAPAWLHELQADADRPLRHRLLGCLGHAGTVPELRHALDETGDGDAYSSAANALALLTGLNLDDELDAAGFDAWWHRHGPRFAPEQRWFAGQPLSPAVLADVIRRGPLPWRALAAQHRQRLTPAGPLFPTELPALQQHARLSLLD